MIEPVNRSEKERIRAIFLEAAEREADAIATLLSESATEDLLGETELALRDAVLKLGAKTLEGSTNERAKKKATKGAVRPATAESRPVSSLGEPSRS